MEYKGVSNLVVLARDVDILGFKVSESEAQLQDQVGGGLVGQR